MPPKRRPPTSSSAPPPQQQEKKPRQSALAKEHSITPATESEIKEVFTLFATATKPPQLPSADLRRALTALGVPPASKTELSDLLGAVDPEDEGTIEYKRFVAVAALKLNSRSEDSRRWEVEEAFELFVGMGGGEGGRITLGCLKRVAGVLKEDVGEGVLRDMLLEANGGAGVERGVDLEGFEGVMRRAGVFR
ncbi:hypothetical protein MMC21_002852 [Puttea exsequens]|nr:hypothetical protein [Puttea exsequens]